MTTTVVEIFGKGCKNCEKLEENFRKAADELEIDYELAKIKEMDKIIERGVFKTPGLAINGEIVSTGRVLSQSRIRELIQSR